MKIPGVERDEDGTIIIEISQNMRLIILAAAALLAIIAIWWVAIKKAESEKKKISRIPGNIPLTEEILPDDPNALTEPERVLGVEGPQSNLNIERLGRADREELEKIFEGILSEGLPRFDSEAVQLYDGLVQRSAEIAPNRSLQFYDYFEAPRQRCYSIAQLYKRWMEIDPVKAVQVAGEKIEDPLLYHILQRDLPRLAETVPSKALEAALLTRGKYFRAVTPDYIRPVMRTWAKASFSDAYKAAVKLKRDGSRREAIQGVAMAKLDTSTRWTDAYSWASKLGSSEDRLWAQMVITELGLYRKMEGVNEAVKNFPHQTLKQHLLRLLEAQRLADAYPESDRRDQTLYLYRSTDPYEYHGRLCVLNTFPDFDERFDEAHRLRSRWPDLGDITFVADGYLLMSGVMGSVPQKPLVNLLERGQLALQNEDLKRAEADFVQYLHYNPGYPEVDPYLTEWSKANDTWLGPGAAKMDEVVLPATSIPRSTSFRSGMAQFQELFEKQAGHAFNAYAFEGISGKPLEQVTLGGSFEEVTAREALDILSHLNGIPFEVKEYGYVGYYIRDEDVAPLMGRPIELIPYPVF